MADRLTEVVCTKNAWTKVADNVLFGQLHVADTSPHYFRGSVDTGDAAPVARDDIVSVPIFRQSTSEPISSEVAIDIYIWCSDTDDGKVILEQ